MSVIEFLQGFFGDRLLGFFLVISLLGGKGIYLVLLSLYYWLIDPKRGRQLGLIFSLSILSNVLIKEAIAAPRPFVINPAVTTVEAVKVSHSYSFPSGHAQRITASWGAIACFHQKLWLWVFAISLIILVSVSRMYLGVHFPIDVTVGILLGIVWIILGLWAGRHEKLQQYQLWQKVSFWAVGGLVAIAFPLPKGLLGIFCGFFPLPQTSFETPQNSGDRLLLSIMGLGLTLTSFVLLLQIRLLLPEFALFDYLQYLAIVLIVTECVPWCWQRIPQVSK